MQNIGNLGMHYLFVTCIWYTGMWDPLISDVLGDVFIKLHASRNLPRGNRSVLNMTCKVAVSPGQEGRQNNNMQVLVNLDQICDDCRG